MSVRLSAWNNSSPNVRLFMKFDICVFFEKLSRKIQVSLKSDKKSGYFARRPIYMFDISLNVKYSERKLHAK
jgi:hypothetical protein